MLGNLKPFEILLILLVVVLLFGAKKLPDMARSLGKSARILKSEAKAMKNDDPTPPAPSGTAAQEQAPARTIQAAPGDTASARPVEDRTTTTG
ncbi:Sec-independent protein translocase subunit TatA [Actinacidiphila epipremni]|jgi:sec-independent protein translocase protein TatA|uniref:Sec-independent protein translocase protein TatA n=1 Tax=Actinacidiphila epipremni TaxID=2053013 RepID=A0ABX0ZSE7_9ACTN|nr:Sec-independent protein translocase subunit TatA [Actinacidiphila epipremni]NJP45930.1 Sec-independent protein translocase subunit TatA [Actinacidiphila epipremni]